MGFTNGFASGFRSVVAPPPPPDPPAPPVEGAEGMYIISTPFCSLYRDDITSLPISVSAAKRHLRVTHGDDDVEIADMIRGAVEYIESVSHQMIVRRGFEYRLTKFPSGVLRLPIVPVASITEVAYIDADGDSQKFTGFDAVLSTWQAAIVPKPGEVWPETTRQAAAVFIKGQAGHSRLPYAAKHAIKLIVGDHYRNREPIGSAINGSARSLINTLKMGHTLSQ